MVYAVDNYALNRADVRPDQVEQRHLATARRVRQRARVRRPCQVAPLGIAIPRDDAATDDRSEIVPRRPVGKKDTDLHKAEIVFLQNRPMTGPDNSNNSITKMEVFYTWLAISEGIADGQKSVTIVLTHLISKA